MFYMLKFVVLGIIPLLLSSCFYYEKTERLAVMGVLDSGSGRKNEFNEYNIGVAGHYDLVYLFNGDTAEVPVGFIQEEVYEGIVDRYIKDFDQSFCNVLIPASDIFGCGHTLRGVVDVDVFLKNKKTGHSILLAKKTIDMDAYFRSVLLTQVFIGSDKGKYLIRKEFNIDWSKMKQIVFEGTNDTLYHHTGWYLDKRESYENDLIEDKFLVEIP